MLRWLVQYWTVTLGAKSTEELDAEHYLFVVATGLHSVASVNCVAFNRWYLLLTSCLAMLAAGTLLAFSTLYDALDVYMYGSQTKTSVTVLYQAYIWMGLSAAISGPFIERRGPRIGMTVATMLLAVGFTLAQLAVTTKAQLFLTIGYGFFCGGGFGMAIVSTMTASQKWFPDIRGLTAGLCMCSFGTGTVAGANVYKAFLNRGGFVQVVTDVRNIPHVFWITGNVRPLLIRFKFSSVVTRTDVHYFQQVKALSLVQCICSTDFFCMYIAFAASIIPAMVFSSEFVAINTKVFGQSVDVINASKVQGLSTPPPRSYIYISLTRSGVVVNLAGQLAIPVISDLIIRVCYANPAYARKIVFFFILSAQLGSMAALSSENMTFESVRSLSFTYVFGSGGSMALIQCFVTDMFGVYHAGTMYGLVFTCWSLRSAIVGYGFADFQVTRVSFRNQMQWMLVVVAIGWVALLFVRTNSVDRFFYGYKYSVCGKVVVQIAFHRHETANDKDQDDSLTILAPPKVSPASNDFVLWNGYDRVRTSGVQHPQARQDTLDTA
ncbi:hypothetical protein DYB31_007752 [Aphanomyces astaci]|uniref:Major facilitator superfamily (MFS) profile domain-containing protein n=1 Tax=Aphanomyces astaci TaxID=112090 RepID=A0A397EEZ2_APHAT|nr:hypothetical protein DYB31_007752 [Aphanomyces astaci]